MLSSHTNSRLWKWCCSFGKLDDGYAFNPHCRSYDGATPSGAVPIQMLQLLNTALLSISFKCF
jgi:hypothetical protein